VVKCADPQPPDKKKKKPVPRAVYCSGFHKENTWDLIIGPHTLQSDTLPLDTVTCRSDELVVECADLQPPDMRVS